MTMTTVFYFAFLAALLELTSGHMCLVSPHQRGSMTGLNKPASNDCILLKKPCGGRSKEMALTTLLAGKNNSIIFQKNLNHWLSSSPGYFAVSILNGTSVVKEIARVLDRGEKDLYLYTVTALIPQGISGPAQLQVRYVTKNPDAPPVFYQCADVMIK